MARPNRWAAWGAAALAAGLGLLATASAQDTVWAWGANDKGQLGDNSTTERHEPVGVHHLTRIVGVSAGMALSFALRSDGTVWAWGDGRIGYLGDGRTDAEEHEPIQVHSLGDVVAISSGDLHCLALRNDGTVWAWGSDYYGQVGNDSSVMDPYEPVLVHNLTDAVAVAGGFGHSLAIRNDATVCAWGDNYFGELGDGTTGGTSHAPVQTLNLTDVVAIAAGNGHSLALRSDGTVWAWGANSHGQLGNDSTTPRDVPVQVHNLAGVVAIAAGHTHSLALASDGTVWAWGNNYAGKLGDNTTTERHEPVQVHGLTQVVALAGGHQHSFALKSDGTVWAWGWNTTGQLGDDSTTERHEPVQVHSLTGATAIAAGYGHGLAIGVAGAPTPHAPTGLWASDGTFPSKVRVTWDPSPGATSYDVWRHTSPRAGLASRVASTLSGTSYDDASAAVGTIYTYWVSANTAAGPSLVSWPDSGYASPAATGTVWTWGRNIYGELGDNSTTMRNEPVAMHNVPDARAIAGGEAHSLVLKSDGMLWGSGYNAWGQLGDGTTTDRLEPVRTLPLTNVTAIASGRRHSLAVVGGAVWAWGDNTYGQLGDDSTTRRPSPVQVGGLGGGVAVAGGFGHSLALTAAGTVWAWGDNAEGELGDGTTTRRLLPVQVQNLSDVVAIAAGYSFSLALKSDGTVWAWGHCWQGRLGNGESDIFAHEALPIQTHNLADVVAISAGQHHALAVRSDGSVWAWGSNGWGVLGIGVQSIEELEPVRVDGIDRAVAVACGQLHSLALRDDGTVWAWGTDTSGQLGQGDDSRTFAREPVQVHHLTGVIAVSAGYEHSLALTAAVPELPRLVAASDGTYTDKVRVTWSPSAGAVSYQVWRNTADVSASATPIASAVIATVFDDTSASFGTTYYYWVRANTASSTSAFSSSDPGYRDRPATVCVDDSNATGQEDGTAQHPFNTIQEGIDAVRDSGTVRVAAGSYTGSLTIADRMITIQGGHVGGTYPGTGDFADATRNPDPSTNATTLGAGSGALTIACQGAGAQGSVVAGLSVRAQGLIVRGGVVLRRVVAATP